MLDRWQTVFNLEIASFKVCIEWRWYLIIFIQLDRLKDNLSVLTNNIPILIDQVTSSVNPSAPPIQQIIRVRLPHNYGIPDVIHIELAHNFLQIKCLIIVIRKFLQGLFMKLLFEVRWCLIARNIV